MKGNMNDRQGFHMVYGILASCALSRFVLVRVPCGGGFECATGGHRPSCPYCSIGKSIMDAETIKNALKVDQIWKRSPDDVGRWRRQASNGRRGQELRDRRAAMACMAGTRA